MRSALTLLDACQELVDCVNRTAPETEDGSFYAVGTPAMRGNVIDLAQARRISAETFTKWTRRLVPREGDLLLAREAPAGPVVRIPPGGKIAAGQRTIHLRANTDIVHPRYLFYLLISPDVQSQLMALAMGTTVPHLRVADVKSFVLPDLPPMGTQAAVQELLGALDDKIAVNDRVAAQCNELAEVYFQVVVEEAAEVPLSEMVDPILGGTPDRSVVGYWGKGNLWASAKDVTGAPFGIVVSTEEEITDYAVTATKAKPVPKGSVILTARGTVGAVARVGQPTSFNQSCYAFTPGKLPAAILYLTVKSAAQRMLAVAHGTVFSTVTKKTFDHIYVPMVSYSEFPNLESRVAPLLDTAECRVRESLSLAELRDTLLPQLMSGEIRVRDAEKVVEDVM